MAVRAVIPGVFVIVGLFAGSMVVLVRVFMKMAVGMLVDVPVRMAHLAVAVFMLMFVLVLVAVLMLVLVLAFHRISLCRWR